MGSERAKIRGQDVYSPYTFRTEDLWDLELPVTTLPIADLLWHLDISFEWETASAENDVASANKVLNAPTKHADAYREIMNVDTARPLYVVHDQGRWVILDGIRRLAQQHARNSTSVQVHVVDLECVS